MLLLKATVISCNKCIFLNLTKGAGWDLVQGGWDLGCLESQFLVLRVRFAGMNERKRSNQRNESKQKCHPAESAGLYFNNQK